MVITRTLRLKVRPEAYTWLDAAAREVNLVWNWCNEVSQDAADRTKRGFGGTDGAGRPMRGAHAVVGFELVYLTAGASEVFDHIGSDTVQCVAREFPRKLAQAKEAAFEELSQPGLKPEERAKIRERIARLMRGKLRWRASGGPKRALGYVPFKAASLKHKGRSLRFMGKAFRVFERERLIDAVGKIVKWSDGCFAQDACGDWWLCLPVKSQTQELPPAPHGDVGFDPGAKDILTGSDGWRAPNPRYTEKAADKLAELQRPRGQRKKGKRTRCSKRISRLHRKVARQARDHAHKVSTKIVGRYQRVAVGDAGTHLVRGTRLGMLKRLLQYKCQQAGRSFVVVSEKLTTQACSDCGSLTGPKGVSMLSVRTWTCTECGTVHDRDINSLRRFRESALPCSPKSVHPIA